MDYHQSSTWTNFGHLRWYPVQDVNTNVQLYTFLLISWRILGNQEDLIPTFMLRRVEWSDLNVGLTLPKHSPDFEPPLTKKGGFFPNLLFWYIANGKTKRVIKCTEIGLYRSNLNTDDVFIIDTGKILYQYNGAMCSADEKFKAAAEIANIRNNRGTGCSES